LFAAGTLVNQTNLPGMLYK